MPFKSKQMIFFTKKNFWHKIYRHFIDYEMRQLRSSEHAFMVLIAIVIGILGGFGAIFFRFAIRFFQALAFGSWHYNLDYIIGLPWYIKLLAPAAGGLIVGPIVFYFAREAKGHGVPEVMESIILHGGAMRPRVVIAKITASAVSIGSGGSVGREGPIVQIGSAIGSVLGQFLKVNGSQLRTFVACGTAAGIAATFNAPIAGALFAMEIILSDFAFSQFSPIVISSVAATVISRHFLGDFPAFVIPHYELVSVWEMIPYAILGVLAAFTALLFINMLYKTEDFFDALSIPGWIKPVVGGLIIGTAGIFFPHIFGVGYGTIDLALESKLTWYFLLLLIVLKLFATSITIGSGGSGGVFAPSLFLGASLGGLVGTVVHLLFPAYSATAGAYALVGMGAVAAGAMHAPITAIIIIFELTNDYRIILPLMVACIISVLITSRFKKDSIYTLKLSRRGLDIFKQKEANILKTVKVADVMKKKVTKIKDNTPFSKLKHIVLNNHTDYLYVADETGHVKGLIYARNIERLIYGFEKPEENATAKDFYAPITFYFTPDDTLDIVLKAFESSSLNEFPVVADKYRLKLIGAVTKDNVIAAYNKEMVRRDMVDTVSGYISSAGRLRRIKMDNGQEMTEIEVPGSFIGKTLPELDLRNRNGVEVILIKQNYDTKTKERHQVITPRPNYHFRFGDSILLIGLTENIEKVKAVR